MSEPDRKKGADYSPGGSPATIKDVALAAGVSTSTVSRALSGKIPVQQETAARIFKAAADLDYTPSLLARGLRDGSSRTIGLIIPDISNPVFPAVALGAESEALKHGYQVILANSHEDPQLELKLIDLMLRRKVEGLLIASSCRCDNLPGWQNLQLPTVQLVRRVCGHLPSVTTNQEQIGQLAAGHLLEKGKKRPLILTGDCTLPLYRQRAESFISTYKQAGFSVVREAVIAAANLDIIRLMSENLDLSQCDSVFASCDIQAMEVIRFLLSRKIAIPEEIAVVGIDNMQIYHLCTPSITSIRQPLQSIGRLALAKILEKIEGRTSDAGSDEISLSCELFCGETT